jgi:uncharacterized protein (TIGR00369 family)
MRWFPLVFDVPLVRLLGLEPLDPNDAASGLSFVVTDNALNAAGVLHGGAIATVLDLAAYLSVLPTLAGDEQAVTHAFSANYLTSTGAGERLVATASLLRRTRHVAFTDVALKSGGRLIATASVTKSIIHTAARPGARLT